MTENTNLEIDNFDGLAPHLVLSARDLAAPPGALEPATQPALARAAAQ
jgi:hypothetical protein